MRSFELCPIRPRPTPQKSTARSLLSLNVSLAIPVLSASRWLAGLTTSRIPLHGAALYTYAPGVPTACTNRTRLGDRSSAAHTHHARGSGVCMGMRLVVLLELGSSPRCVEQWPTWAQPGAAALRPAPLCQATLIAPSSTPATILRHEMGLRRHCVDRLRRLVSRRRYCAVPRSRVSLKLFE